MLPDGDRSATSGLVVVLAVFVPQAALGGTPTTSAADGDTRAAKQPRRPRRIYVMDADGGDERRVKATDDRDENDPSWTPDGQHLLFSTSWRGNALVETVGLDGKGRDVLLRRAHSADLHAAR